MGHLYNTFTESDSPQSTDGVEKTYTHLTPSFPRQPGYTGIKDKTILDFNEARDDGLEVASTRPYANHLHLALDR